MSRTYRKSYLNEYSNIESYTKHRKINWVSSDYWRSVDEADLRLYWQEASRDGCFDYGRNASYRRQTNNIIRAKNRHDLKKVFDDPELFEETNFATKKDAKHLIWLIW